MKKIIKMILTTTPLIYVYFLAYFIYVISNVIFVNLLGCSVDMASKSNNDFCNFFWKLILATFISMILLILTRYLNNILQKKIFIKLRSQVSTSIICKNLHEYNKNTSDYYFGLLVNDVKLIEEQFIKPLFDIVCEMILLVVTAITMFSINIETAIFVIIVSALPIVIPMLFSSKLQEKMGKYMIANNKFLNDTTEEIEGYETFCNYGEIDFVKKRFTKSNEKLNKKKKEAYLFLEVLMNELAVISSLVIIGILIFGMYMALNNKLTIGEVFSLMLMSGFVVEPLGQIAQSVPQLLGNKDLINKYIDCCENNIIKNKKASFNKEICCKNSTLTINDSRILDEINISLKKGKKYALVGGSGSGKSTLVKALLGQYEEVSESIFYDSDMISNIDANSIFNDVTYISQVSCVFTGTIRDNLTMFNSKGYSDSVLYEVLELLNLKTKIDSLDNGLDTVLQENENNFSGGEKQRISIARALLRGKKIFILDEITSALDYDNYINVERVLMSIVGATVISITHRLEAKVLRAYDNIFVMEQGKLVESGNFDDLMELGGYFTELYNAQVL